MTWTDNERDLLRNVHHHLGHVLANPAGGIEYLRSGHISGGGGGFGYEFGATAIRGQWHEWIPDRWRPDGRPCRWHHGDLLRTASVSYARLEAWAESLPAKVRDRARTFWRVWPENTRDLAALDRVTLAAIDSDTAAYGTRRKKAPRVIQPLTVPSECGDQYALAINPEGGVAL